MPGVTVVMPAYNAARYLRESVDSILGQTFRDFEFLIVNDGSTDATSDILGTFHDPRIFVLKNDRNLGVAPSLNLALSRASGTYVARMDADDISLPARLERQVQWLNTRPEVALLGTDTIMIDGTGKAIGRESYPATEAEIRHSMFVHNPFAHGTVMFRRDVVRHLGGYDARCLHNEDYDLWLRIAASHGVANLSEPLVQRRVHPASVTSSRETELVYHRIRTVGHAIRTYYRSPRFAIYLARPIAAYTYRRIRDMFR